MKKIKWILYIALLIVGVPLLMDWLIIGNSFPSNLSNSEWVSFFSGYIGAIIGAVVSLVGIYATIRFTKEQLETNKIQYEEQKRLSYIPMLDCEISNLIDGTDCDAISMDVEYTLGSKNELKAITVMLDICNIGVGAALGLKYGIKLSNQEIDGVFWDSQTRLIKSQELLKQKITIFTPFNKEFKPTLVIYYDDVLGNKYEKCIDLVIDYRSDDQIVLFIETQEKGTLRLSDNNKKLYYVYKSMK